MKKRKYLFVCIATCMLSISACSLVGLDLQEDHEHKVTTLDPHVNINALEWMKKRNSDAVYADSVFFWMLKGIAYAGLEEEYTKAGRTFLFLHNDAVLRKTNNDITNDCYFGRYKVISRDAAGNPILNVDGSPVLRSAEKWEDYSVDQVRNFLTYLIIEGEYSFENLTDFNTTVNTFLPKGAEASNPESIMTLLVRNDRDSKLRINDFLNSVRASQARTAGILSTNGPIHVVDRVIEYGTIK
ncbi:fasciclin domain-containing protein [Olivibacter domesticus]|uniref:Fasciclin domain-containing protein n=1 Tax=Olivibacter domesticus TaxID=407022 RepID=A0A1H7QFF8_OLID1|nr:fasciclin domain-containing protein [Olivibacter domesticus]SEL46841.1 Fasciclin domain-containing protein [Olivibacter domesticus]